MFTSTTYIKDDYEVHELDLGFLHHQDHMHFVKKNYTIFKINGYS